MRALRFFLMAAVAACFVGLAGCGGEGAEPAAVEEAAPAREPAEAEAPEGLPTAELHVARERVEAPDFALETLGGDVLRLSDLRGQVVVLNLWATWCGPCRYEIPDFIELQRALRDEGVRFVGVALDEGGEAVVRPYAERMGINYPVVVDDGRVEAAYGPTTVMPTTLVIDREGIVRRVAFGMLDGATLRPVLEELAAEPG